MAAEAILTTTGVLGLGACLAIGISAIGMAIGQKEVLPAAVGAISENPKLFAKALIFAVLPETIIIFGFVVAFLIIGLNATV